MGLLKKLFRVREIREMIDPLPSHVGIGIAVSAVFFVSGMLIDKYSDMYFIYSAAALVPTVILIVASLDDILKAADKFECVRKGERHQGKIIGRTEYRIIRHTRYATRKVANLVIEYGDSRKHITCAMRKKSIERLASFECGVYVCDGKICVDDFHCTLFKSKQHIEIDTMKITVEI